MITEAQLEDLACEWFTSLGWNYVHGEAIVPDGPAPERGRRLDNDWSENGNGNGNG